MKFLSVLGLVALAAAAPSKAPALDVKLEADGNSGVKAVISNNGKKDLKIMKTGTILDSAPVEKATVLSGGKTCSHKLLFIRSWPMCL